VVASRYLQTSQPIKERTITMTGVAEGGIECENQDVGRRKNDDEGDDDDDSEEQSDRTGS
jgi:hypothetical protein